MKAENTRHALRTSIYISPSELLEISQELKELERLAYIGRATENTTERFAEIDGTICCKACGVGGVNNVDNYCFNCGAKFKEATDENLR